MSDFVHLHNHTDYSLLDAAQTVEVMCNRVYDLGMDSIAVTDHGNLFAMLPFYQQAKKTGIKPIIGCSFDGFALFAKNKQGWSDLIKLVSSLDQDGKTHPKVLRSVCDNGILLSVALDESLSPIKGHNFSRKTSTLMDTFYTDKDEAELHRILL